MLAGWRQWWVVVLGVVLFGPAGWRTSTAAAEERVLVVTTGTRAQHHRVMEVVAERLQPLHVTVTAMRVDAIDVDGALRPDATAEDALARVWIDLPPSGAATLYLTDRSWSHVLVRSFDATLSDEILREELGLIVVTAVETLAGGAAVGAPREQVLRDLGMANAATVQPPPAAPPAVPPPLTAPAPVPAPSPPSADAESPAPWQPSLAPAWRVGGALIYEAQGYAAEQVIVHGPGLSVSVDAPGVTVAPGLMFDVHYRVPYQQQSADAGFELQSLALRLQAHLHLLRDPAVALRLHGGMAAETLFMAPFLVAGGAAQAASSRVRVAPIARLGMLVDLRLFGETALRIGFSGDVDIIGTRYVIARGAELIPLVEPLRIRPSLTVGIATTLAGGSLFPVVDDPFGS